MYLADLSPYKQLEWTYRPHKVLAVGWLDKKYPFPTGPTTDLFKERLAVFCENILFLSFGIHSCEFCGLDPDSLERTPGAGMAGSAETLILGANKTLYCIPDLIHHYVVAHFYQPPQEFIEAVLTSPLPQELPGGDYEALFKAAELVPPPAKPKKIFVWDRVTLSGILAFTGNKSLSSNDYDAQLTVENNQFTRLAISKEVLDAAGGMETLSNKLVTVEGSYLKLRGEQILDVRAIE